MLRGALVVAGRAAKSVGAVLHPRLFEPFDVEPVSFRPGSVHEAEKALSYLRQGELICKYRRYADRHHALLTLAGPALTKTEKGQIGRRERFEEPFLPKGPGAKALDVWHVAV